MTALIVTFAFISIALNAFLIALVLKLEDRISKLDISISKIQKSNMLISDCVEIIMKETYPDLYHRLHRLYYCLGKHVRDKDPEAHYYYIDDIDPINGLVISKGLTFDIDDIVDVQP
jgi:hypothetical protein